MSTTINVDQRPKPVAATKHDPATLHHVSGGPISYGTSPEGIEPIGQIEAGDTVEVDRPQWIFAAASNPAKALILRNEDR